MDLTEAEEIKKWWQEYTEELYKKGLNYLDNDDDDVTHLEPDILYCEVKWALGSITMGKDSGGDGIPAELFQILKDNAIKMLQTCQQIWKTQHQETQTVPNRIKPRRNPPRHILITLTKTKHKEQI